MKKPSIGLYVSGDEENIRNAVAALAGELSEKNQSIESLMETYLDIDVKEIEDIIHNWNDNYNMHLNEVNINNLAFHASVMLMRIGKNKALLIENSKALDSETFSYKEEFDILINELSTYGNCEIPKDEADYLLMHLLGMYLNESSFLENDFLNDLRKIAENIAEDFILKSDKIMSLDLESNDQFKRSLMLHLLPTVYRLKYGLNLYNPLLNEIKTNYASYYYLALIINSSFKKYIGVNASEGEIAYVALHLSVAVQQAKDHVQVAVVCSLGVGVSRLLSVKLQENFPDVTFIHCSMNDEEQLEKCKYIISTVELNTDKPYVQVNPLLMEVDVQKIRTLLRKNPSINKTNFSMQTVKVFHEQIDKIQILQEMSNYLRMCGAVTPRFFEGVLKRENMGFTEVGDGIILTHGFHEDVKRTQIAFCKLDHPIVWKTQEVDFIVMLAVAKTDAKNVMQMNWLYKMLSNMEIVNKIRECKKDREIYETLIESSRKIKYKKILRVHIMNLLDILDLDLIDLDMGATDKDGVLKQLSSMLYKKGNIKDLDKFLEAVYERESIGETGLGGIAIPHGLTDQVINASVAIGKVKQPVEWESLDDQPVSLIFLLAAPTGDLQKTHLQNLSQLASVVAHKAHVDALMKCETKEEFFELFETYFNEFTKRKEA